ncbi:minor tail protein [Bacillus phage Thurquoise]|nr:minor tail protein [Bacillus phage Thurquoise]
MASGGFDLSTSNTYVKGRVNWSSTANTNENYSNVYVEMRFSRTNSGYTTYGTGTFGLYLDGQQAVNTTGFSITQNSNTLVVSGSFRINHNSDGTKNFRIGASGYSDVFNVNDGSTIAYMDNIPRASTISSNISWTAAIEGLPITINRASTAFDHLVTLEVQKPDGGMAAVAWRSGVGDNVTFYFSKEETTILYQSIGGFEQRPVKVKVQTWNNGNVIGETEKWGTVYGATPATPVVGDFDIGTASVAHTLDYYYDTFNYTLTFTLGSFTKTFPNVTKFTPMTFTSADFTEMYKQIPNAISRQATVYASTKYNGVELNDGLPKSQTTTINVRVTNSNPTYAGGFTYLDTNATTATLTGNNQYIVQGKSTLQIKIPATAKATANNAATMSRYDVTVNGVTQSVNYATTDLTVNFNEVNASSNATATITAVDSRGNKTSASAVILILPYSPPSLSASADRLNNFETSTTIKLSGSASPLTISGSNKNTITSAKYQYRQVGGNYNTAANFTVTGFPNFTATNVTVNLDNTIAWEVLITVTDKAGSTVMTTRTIAVGTPIFFIDTVKKTLGINKFPTSATNGLEIAGDLDVDGIIKLKPNQWVAQGKYGLHANGADIMSVNSIYFSSQVTSVGQGLNFIRPGKIAGSTTAADYSTFGILDYALRMNNQNIFYQFPGTGNIRLGGELHTSSTNGVFFDGYGNIKGQPGAQGGETWSIIDSKSRTKLTIPVGNNGGNNTYRAYGGNHRFEKDGNFIVEFYSDGTNNIANFGGGIFKWQAGVTSFEIRNWNDTGWANLSLGELTAVKITTANLVNTSSRTLKTEIEPLAEDALQIILDSEVCSYLMKASPELGRKVGLIAEDSHSLVQEMGGKGVNGYTMTSLSWRAIQQLDNKLEVIKNLILNHINEEK